MAQAGVVLDSGNNVVFDVDRRRFAIVIIQARAAFFASKELDLAPDASGRIKIRNSPNRPLARFAWQRAVAMMIFAEKYRARASSKRSTNQTG
jgi:hypothetical protein